MNDTLMPLLDAHALSISGSTETIATREELKLSPTEYQDSLLSDTSFLSFFFMFFCSAFVVCVKFLPYTKHCATNLLVAYTFSIFSGAIYSPCASLNMFFFL